MRRLLRWALWLVAMVIGLTVVALAGFRWQADRREVVAAAKAAPPGGRYVKAGDVDVFVQEAGPLDGVPVLFVHGTGAWSEAWRGAMKATAESGARAIAIDLPPFGFSQRPPEPRYGKLDQGKRIVAVLEALDLKQAILVGHSFGGGPTTEAALLAPQRVRALILVDAALGISSDDAAAPPSSALVDSLLAVQPLRDAVVATFLTNPRFTRKLLQGFIDDPARATDDWVGLYQRPLVVTGTTAAVGAWLPTLIAPKTVSASERPASYKAMKTPLYVIWGDRDTITPLDQAKRLVTLAPRSDLAIMRGVGHIPQIEDPDGFAKVLVAALAKASSASSNP
jgi:pimeloyl-ACP methyl ester carboxylesterase